MKPFASVVVANRFRVFAVPDAEREDHARRLACRGVVRPKSRDRLRGGAPSADRLRRGAIDDGGGISQAGRRACHRAWSCPWRPDGQPRGQPRDGGGGRWHVRGARTRHGRARFDGSRNRGGQGLGRRNNDPHDFIHRKQNRKRQGKTDRRARNHSHRDWQRSRGQAANGRIAGN